MYRRPISWPRFFVHIQIGLRNLVPALVVLCLPSVVTILVQDRFAVDALVALSRDVAACVIGRCDFRIAIGKQRWFFIRTEIGYANLVPALVVLRLPSVITFFE